MVTKHPSNRFCYDVISDFTLHYEADFCFHQRDKHFHLLYYYVNTIHFWNRIISYTFLKRKHLRKTCLNMHLTILFGLKRTLCCSFTTWISWIIINRLTGTPKQQFFTINVSVIVIFFNLYTVNVSVMKRIEIIFNQS